MRSVVTRTPITAAVLLVVFTAVGFGYERVSRRATRPANP
jgi:hypothetical protein